MYVSLETLVKKHSCSDRNVRFVRDSRKKSTFLHRNVRFARDSRKKMNVAVKEMDVSLQTLVKKQRCRKRNVRFARDSRKKKSMLLR